MPKLLIQYISDKCNKFKYLAYPDTTPVINTLSLYESTAGSSTTVYINGDNFSLDGRNGYSTVNFGNYKNISVAFYNSQNISFQVPTTASQGNYGVVVVNKSQYPLYSNSVNYTLQ